jgi:hypothetical protein
LKTDDAVNMVMSRMIASSRLVRITFQFFETPSKPGTACVGLGSSLDPMPTSVVTEGSFVGSPPGPPGVTAPPWTSDTRVAVGVTTVAVGWGVGVSLVPLEGPPKPSWGVGVLTEAITGVGVPAAAITGVGVLVGVFVGLLVRVNVGVLVGP